MRVISAFALLFLFVGCDIPTRHKLLGFKEVSPHILAKTFCMDNITWVIFRDNPAVRTVSIKGASWVPDKNGKPVPCNAE